MKRRIPTFGTKIWQTQHTYTHKNTKDKPCSNIKGNILVFKMYVHYKITKAKPAIHTQVGIFRKNDVIRLFMFQYVEIIKFIICQRKCKTIKQVIKV